MSKLCALYKDFTVRFEHWNSEDGSYQVFVETANRKKTTATFVPPYAFRRTGDPEIAVDSFRGERERQEIYTDDIGKQLYRSLFHDQIGEFYAEGLALAKQEGFGLRLKLCADLSTPGMSELVSLPWEKIERYGEELCLSVCSPLVRFLDTNQPFWPIDLEDRLRILVAMANPEVPHLKSLNLEEEYKRIYDRFSGSKVVEIEKMSPVNIESLLERLSHPEKPVHVLHFMGHGDMRNGEGQLVFEKEDGSPEYVSGRTLVRFILHDAEAMQLVFLNACNTAGKGSTARSEVFSGIASTIIKTGMPAVIAMQEPIKDTAAIEFADTFYTRLAHGDSVERALTEGRKKIGIFARESFDWAIPVLYMHAPDGVLFPSLQNGKKMHGEEVASEAPLPSIKDVPTPGTQGENKMRKLVYLICDRNDITSIRPLFKFLSHQKNIDVEIPAFDGSSAQEIAEANRRLLAACDNILHFYGAGDAAWKKSITSELRSIPGLEARTKPVPPVYTYIAAPSSFDKDLLRVKVDRHVIDASHIDPKTLYNQPIEVLNNAFGDLLHDFMHELAR